MALSSRSGTKPAQILKRGYSKGILSQRPFFYLFQQSFLIPVLWNIFCIAVFAFVTRAKSAQQFRRYAEHTNVHKLPNLLSSYWRRHSRVSEEHTTLFFVTSKLNSILLFKSESQLETNTLQRFQNVKERLIRQFVTYLYINLLMNIQNCTLIACAND